MAAAVEQAWPTVDLDGIVITRYAHGLPTRAVRVVEAGHPVPDAAGEAAAREILDRVQKMRAGDLLLALVSGGGSSLLSLPVPEVPMDDLKRVTRELLASGAPIEQMNVVRKHLSQIAGGRLADAAVRRDARVLALIVSDVTGDAPTDIASGPCTPDPSTYADALAILQRWSVTPPASVADWLARGARGEVPETPKPGRPALCSGRKPCDRHRPRLPGGGGGCLQARRHCAGHSRRHRHRRGPRGREGIRRARARGAHACGTVRGAHRADFRRRMHGDATGRIERTRRPLQRVPAVARGGARRRSRHLRVRRRHRWHRWQRRQRRRLACPRHCQPRRGRGRARTRGARHARRLRLLRRRGQPRSSPARRAPTSTTIG